MFFFCGQPGAQGEGMEYRDRRVAMQLQEISFPPGPASLGDWSGRLPGHCDAVACQGFSLGLQWGLPWGRDAAPSTRHFLCVTEPFVSFHRVSFFFFFFFA